jgi:thioredoxin reductase (NADPH)
MIDTDCLVIGGGPAGLTAAIYLARFHLSVIVVDAGHSRAASIPMTRNHAGFPDGIPGATLLERMRDQALRYGARIVGDTVTGLTEASERRFIAQTDDRHFSARTVLLATGVVNHRPEGLDDEAHARAVALGQIRYCPICDGYEVTDKRVAVLGSGERGTREALFLRSFTADLSLVSPGQDHTLDALQRAELSKAGVMLLPSYTSIASDGDHIALTFASRVERFDSLYPALGSDIRSDLARAVGAETSGEGCLLVDAHQRTTVAGLYAAGDVVLGLDQISHAMGEGGVAATTIRNDLDNQSALCRRAL